MPGPANRTIAALVTALLTSCADPGRARATLEAQGFTRITITGGDALACADGELLCTGFTGRAPSGRRVRGVVGCSGWIDWACTVRITP